MKMKTTFIDRSNTNEEVYRRANECIKHSTPANKIPKKVKPFAVAYQDSKAKRYTRILKQNNSNPVKQTTFRRNSILPNEPLNRKVGRPKNKWVTEAARHMWNTTKQAQPFPLTNRGFRMKDTAIQIAIANHASM